MAEQEGVIKYQLNFEEKPLPATVDISELNHWRNQLCEKDLVGQDDNRYDGYGFGNLSLRLDKHSFLITGTQTGEIPELQRQHFAVVTAFNKTQNSIQAYGECKPSSEALSHGAIFQVSENIKAVFHVHSPEIWNNHKAINRLLLSESASSTNKLEENHDINLHIKTTAAEVPYGTPQMANAMQELVSQPCGCIVMLGHEDGVISWGESCEQAGEVLLEILRCSYLVAG